MKACRKSLDGKIQPRRDSATMTAVYPTARQVSTHLNAPKTIIGTKEVRESPISHVREDLFTKTSHVLTDDWMASLSGNEWKVVSYIDRWTTGYQDRPYFETTVAEIMRATGIKSDRTIDAVLINLEKRGVVEREYIMQGTVCCGIRLRLNKSARIGKAKEPVQREYIPSPHSRPIRPVNNDPMALPAITPSSMFSSSTEKLAPSARNDCPPFGAKNAPLINKGKDIPIKKQQTKTVVPASQKHSFTDSKVVVSECIKNALADASDTVTVESTHSPVPVPEKPKEAPCTPPANTPALDTDAIAAVVRYVRLDEPIARRIVRAYSAEVVLRQAMWFPKRCKPNQTTPEALFRHFCKEDTAAPTEKKNAFLVPTDESHADHSAGGIQGHSVISDPDLIAHRRNAQALRARGIDLQVKRGKHAYDFTDEDLEKALNV